MTDYRDDSENQGFVDYLTNLSNEGSLHAIQAKCQSKSHRHYPAEPRFDSNDNWLVSKKSQQTKTDRLLAKHYYRQLLVESGRERFYPISTQFPKD